MSHLVSLHGPAINLSLLQTLMYQFVWPHFASGMHGASRGVCAYRRLTPGWQSPFSEPPAAASVHLVLRILEGLSLTGAGCPWHEVVWSQESSGAMVHMLGELLCCSKNLNEAFSLLRISKVKGTVNRLEKKHNRA